MNRKSRKQRSLGSRSGGRKQGLGKVVSRELSDGPAYAGQQCVTLKLPGTPMLLTSIITTGVIANVTNLNVTDITGFSTRFGSTFDEYRILGVNVMLRPVAVSTGVSVAWFDEKSPAAPTANEAQERIGKRLTNTNASDKSVCVMRWRARDLLDLEYQPISGTTTPVYWKLYTDLATWGSPGAATPLWIVEPVFLIEFRGIKSS